MMGLVVITILAFSILILHQLITHFSVNSITYVRSPPPGKSRFIVNMVSTQSQTSVPSLPVYSLDNECKTDFNESTSQIRRKEFDKIFDERIWNRMGGSRSGSGSSLEGAFDWIAHLRTLMEHHSIQSIADIPCGDTYWQFGLREINTIEKLYFGGDISTRVVEQNKKLYRFKHNNKLFQYWDLVNCPILTFTYRNSTHEIKGNRFDLIIVRDALQHMHIKNGLKAVRNVIMSGAKYFALSTYPPNGKPAGSVRRSIGKNSTLPLTLNECINSTYCSTGAITDGGFYQNNINCHPFNFPLSKAILVQPSHEKFPIEHDEMHIYKIDDEFKSIVEKYDKACT
ncbi:unnamed protein product [Rotaria magnacalcarata]|uniref:Methyltransferase type 11 domain-containing protein n=1 Tax=Rotaria magnacalcarata TaxID=392030 RepID=A0A816ZKY7_9BILA|nr:unnamed protein product [Rotaria magnacalcarata]CAF3943719.1 unnamed protein product [Rotaria magnacalcarata]